MTLNAGGEDNTGLIGHEVGHLYWVSGYEWISEGGAEVLAGGRGRRSLKFEERRAALVSSG